MLCAPLSRAKGRTEEVAFGAHRCRACAMVCELEHKRRGKHFEMVRWRACTRCYVMAEWHHSATGPGAVLASCRLLQPPLPSCSTLPDLQKKKPGSP